MRFGYGDRLPEAEVVVRRDPGDEMPREVDAEQRENSRDRRRPGPVHARDDDRARALASRPLFKGVLRAELGATAEVYH